MFMGVLNADERARGSGDGALADAQSCPVIFALVKHGDICSFSTDTHIPTHKTISLKSVSLFTLHTLHLGRCVCLCTLTHCRQALMWRRNRGVSVSRHTAGPGGKASSSPRNALPFSRGVRLIQAHLHH